MEIKDLVQNIEHTDSVSELTEHSKDQNVSVKRAVSKNVHCPQIVLAELSDDADFEVRCGVIENPNTSPDILYELLDGTNVYACITDNPKATGAMLEVVYKKVMNIETYTTEIIRDIATHQNASSNLLEIISHEQDRYINAMWM